MTASDKVSRRSLLKGAAACAAITATGGFRIVELAMAKSREDAASSLVRWGMLIDTQKLTDGGA